MEDVQYYHNKLVIILEENYGNFLEKGWEIKWFSKDTETKALTNKKVVGSVPRDGFSDAIFLILRFLENCCASRRASVHRSMKQCKLIIAKSDR